MVDADQVRRDYAAHGVKQQVRFGNANNNVRTADENRPTNSKQASSKQRSNKGQHHKGNLAANVANNLVTNMSDNGTDKNDNDIDDNNVAYKHGYKNAFDVGTAYAAG